MVLSLQKSLFLFLGTVLLCSLMPAAAMAVDNLESGNELNQASLLGSFMRDNYFPESVSKAELLDICLPSDGRLGIIAYCLDSPQKIALSVYDQKGREVVELVNRTEVSGEHQARWDGCCNDGEQAPEGTYFLMMKTEESVFLRRLVLDR